MASRPKSAGSGTAKGRRRGANARAVRISDVAALAEVSTATVSRALAAPDTVSAATRERVMSAVRATGYTPNLAARSLRVQRTMTVLVVVPWKVTPFFSDLLFYLDRALGAHGYSVLIGDLNDRAKQEPRLVNLVAAGQVDGVILINGEILSDGARRIDEMGVPIIGLCVPVAPNIPAVLVDDSGGGRAVAEHLLGLGHRAFGYVSGPAGNFNELGRWGGFRDALAAAGIAEAAVARYAGSFHVATGAAAARAYLAGDTRPTAVFCASDMMAVGFIQTLHAAGLAVPHDVSVVGFDGIELGAYCTPALTTVEQPCEAMARVAAAETMALVNGGSGNKSGGGGEVERAAAGPIAVTLTVRDSTAPPRDQPKI